MGGVVVLFEVVPDHLGASHALTPQQVIQGRQLSVLSPLALL